MTEKKNPYRVGIIGGGKKAYGHARGYEWHPRTQVVAVADTDPENLKLFADTFKIPGYANYQDMLAKEKIDIAAPILPVTPNPSVVIGCAKAGVKAIYCEKPIAAKLSDADAMVAECKKRNIVFAGGDAYINIPEHWKVLELIKSGELGRVQSINLYQATDEISGGGCQGLSALRRFAFDAPTDWVTGWCGGDPKSDDDQNMGGVVQFSNGVTGFIHNKNVGKDGIEVLCEKGYYTSSWDSGHLFRTGSKRNQYVEDAHFFDEFGGTDGWLTPSGRRQKGGMVSLIDAMEHGKPLRCSGENLRDVLEIAIALRESHRRGFAAVKLPLPDRSLTLNAAKGRMLNKKEVYGKDWYAPVIARAASGTAKGD